jgi:hypothetical protein
MRRVILISLIFLLANAGQLMAQCAMCRSTLENNYSNGNPGIAAGINTGILYLLSLPYLAAMIIGYLWYKSSKYAGKKSYGSVSPR